MSVLRTLTLSLTLLGVGCSSDSLFGDDESDGDNLSAAGIDKLEAGGPDGPPPTFSGPTPPMSIPVGSPTFAIGDGAALFLVVDRGDDYGAVLRSDGAPPIVLANDIYRPTGIAVDGARVYFSSGNPSGASTTLRSIDKASGGDGRDSFLSGWGASAFSAVAIQGSTLAWSSKTGDAGSYTVFRGLADGTGVETSATNQSAVAAIAVAGPYVYWTQNTELLRKKAGAPVEAPPERVDARGLFTSLASDGLDVYATSDDGTLITTSATDEPPTVKVLATGLMQPRGVAVDSWFAYVVSTGSATVNAVNRRSSRLVELGRGGDPYALAVTTGAVWIIDRANHAMTSVPKVPR